MNAQNSLAGIISNVIQGVSSIRDNLAEFDKSNQNIDAKMKERAIKTSQQKIESASSQKLDIINRMNQIKDQTNTDTTISDVTSVKENIK